MFSLAPEVGVFQLCLLSDIEGACGGEDSDQQDERAL